jgi:hypothetical protein
LESIFTSAIFAKHAWPVEVVTLVDYDDLHIKGQHENENRI